MNAELPTALAFAAADCPVWVWTSSRIDLSLLVVSAASAVSTATAAAASNLGNGGFEKPVVSGMVPEPKGTFLGPCVPLLSGPGHCWQVTSDMTALVHDDFMTGGVA